MSFFKNVLIVILTALTFSTAQDSPVVNRFPVLGLRGGFLVSGFWGNGIRQLENRVREQTGQLTSKSIFFYTGGFWGSWGIIPDFISVQPEFIYLRTGKSWEVKTDFLNVNAKLDNDYFAVPVIFKIHIPLQGNVHPYAYLGPQAMIRFNTSIRGFSGSSFDKESILGNTNRFDFGICTGAGMDFFTKSKDMWQIDFRYTFGTLNLFGTDRLTDIRNSVFSFTTGFGWKMKR